MMLAARTQIRITEYVVHNKRPGSPTVSKTISVGLSHDARKALLAYLLASEEGASK